MIQSITKERLATFSDGVFAVIITIMVLQLKLPHHPTFKALLEEWPTALSYVVSYFLIVIMWINHHYLWGFAKHSTPKYRPTATPRALARRPLPHPQSYERCR